MNDSSKDNKQNPALKVTVKMKNHRNTLAMGKVPEFLHNCDHRAKILKEICHIDPLNLAKVRIFRPEGKC